MTPDADYDMETVGQHLDEMLRRIDEMREQMRGPDANWAVVAGEVIGNQYILADCLRRVVTAVRTG